MAQNELVLGLVQMASEPDWAANVARVKTALAQLAGRCDLAVFPENVFCLGSGATILGNAREICDLYAELGALCRDAGLAAVFGGVPVAESGHVMNSSLAFDVDGWFLARYDKMHLFQLNPGLPDGIDETTHYGSGPIPLSFEFRGWTIGLSICYDLRFPELFRAYAGAHLMLCTAAFTRMTGLAHWELLLRARAVENLCYVAGVGQCGINQDSKVEHYGNSMLVDPWGEVLCRLDDTQPGLVTMTLSHERVRTVRQMLPALRHRRLEVTQTDDEHRLDNTGEES